MIAGCPMIEDEIIVITLASFQFPCCCQIVFLGSPISLWKVALKSWFKCHNDSNLEIAMEKQ